MPSVVGNLIKSQIYLLKPLLKRLEMDIEASRRSQDKLGELGARMLKNKVDYVAEHFENFEADWAVPSSCENEGTAILYLHGGSYCAGTLAYAKGFGGIISDITSRRTLCVGYRLAPENPFPAAVDDALEAYKRVLESYAPDKIACVGESAGGGLTFALLLKIKQENLPLPACAVALSPWADLTCTAASLDENDSQDPSLFGPSLIHNAELYAGDDLKNPLVSPVFGDLAGLPDSLIFVGGDELLRDDSFNMRERLIQAGCNCECHVEEGMWHVYVLYGIPESRAALERITSFIEEKLNRASRREDK